MGNGVEFFKPVRFFKPEILTIDQYIKNLRNILSHPDGGMNEFIKTIIIDLNIIYADFNTNKDDIDELKNKINIIIEELRITDDELNNIIENILLNNSYNNLNETMVKNFFNLY